MNVDDILSMMDEMLEKAWSVPLSGGRCVVDVEKMRDMIDDIRLNMPMEIKHAKAIVADRKDIIEDAKKEADTMIKKAEERVRVLVSDDEITKAAREKASEILSEAQMQSRQLRKAAADFAGRTITSTEESLVNSLNEVKKVKQQLRLKQ